MVEKKNSISLCSIDSNRFCQSTESFLVEFRSFFFLIVARLCAYTFSRRFLPIPPPGTRRSATGPRVVSSAVVIVRAPMIMFETIWTDDTLGNGRGESTAKAGLGKDAVGEPNTQTHKTTAVGVAAVVQGGIVT